MKRGYNFFYRLVKQNQRIWRTYHHKKNDKLQTMIFGDLIGDGVINHDVKNEDLAAFGNYIRAARDVAGLSREELSQSAGIPSAEILALEHGLYRPPDASLCKLAGALDEDIDLFEMILEDEIKRPSFYRSIVISTEKQSWYRQTRDYIRVIWRERGLRSRFFSTLGFLILLWWSLFIKPPFTSPLDISPSLQLNIYLALQLLLSTAVSLTMALMITSLNWRRFPSIATYKVAILIRQNRKGMVKRSYHPMLVMLAFCIIVLPYLIKALPAQAVSSVSPPPTQAQPWTDGEPETVLSTPRAPSATDNLEGESFQSEINHLYENNIANGMSSSTLRPDVSSPRSQIAEHSAAVALASLRPKYELPQAVYGDPIATSNGNFIEPELDLVVSRVGFNDLKLERVYNAQTPNRAGVFGQGWSSLFDMRIIERESAETAEIEILVRYADGTLVEFEQSSDGFYPKEAVSREQAARFIHKSHHLQMVNGSSYRFNQEGELIEYSDRNGNRIEFIYDELGQIASVANTAGHLLKISYQDGHIQKMTTNLGREVSYQYDDAGYLTHVFREDGQTQHYLYNKNRLARIKGIESQTFRYDQLGRVVYWQNGRVETEINYNNSHISLIKSEAGIPRVRHEYDLNRLIVREIDPLGNEAVFHYDEQLNLILYRDKNRNQSNFAYDARGNLLTQTDAIGNTTQFVYDDSYRIIQVTDARGYETIYKYDEHGRLTAITNGRGTTVRLEYADFSWPVAIIDGREERTSYAYDTDKNRIESTNALGYRDRWTYDARGFLIQRIDSGGGVYTYDYDEVGNLIRHTDPLNYHTIYGYDVAGNLISITDANRHTTQYTYDALGRLSSQQDARGSLQVYKYDDLGRVIQIENNQALFSYEYDPVGRLVAETDPLGNVHTYKYDPNGNKTSIQDPRGHITRYRYDALNREIETINPRGFSTYSHYDHVGNLVAVKNEVNKTTHYQYDQLNRIVRMTDPNGAQFEYRYDANDNLTYLIDPLSITTKYIYDPLNRVTAVIHNYQESHVAQNDVNVTELYKYDSVGNLIQTTNPNGQLTRYVYDFKSQMVQRVFSNRVQALYLYDGLGNVALSANENEAMILYSYNEASQLLTERPINQDEASTSYQYDLSGNLLRAHTSDAVSTYYVYDELNRVTTAVNHENDSLHYTYDPVGNRTSLTYPDGKVVTYTYDENNNLLGLGTAAGQRTQYSYDAKDRLTQVSHPDSTTIQYQYGPTGRLVETTVIDRHRNLTTQTDYQYDAVGNRLSMKTTSTSSDEIQRTIYRYDLLRRLTWLHEPSGQITQLMYDAAGRRIGESTKLGNESLTQTTYTYDSSGALLSELTHDDRHQLTKKTTYRYGHKGQLLETNKFDWQQNEWLLENRFQYIYDGLGRLAARIEQNSGSKTSYTYDGYKQIKQISNETDLTYFYYGTGGQAQFTSNGHPQNSAYYYHLHGLSFQPAEDSVVKPIGLNNSTSSFSEFNIVEIGLTLSQRLMRETQARLEWSLYILPRFNLILVVMAFILLVTLAEIAKNETDPQQERYLSR